MMVGVELGCGVAVLISVLVTVAVGRVVVGSGGTVVAVRVTGSIVLAIWVATGSRVSGAAWVQALRRTDVSAIPPKPEAAFTKSRLFIGFFLVSIKFPF
jgi:hypothetical protein